jgi:gamma-glutamyltranspeptidase / glutathione hydrolase
VSSHRAIAAIMVVAVSCAQTGLAADLSPSNWNPTEKARAELRQNAPFPAQGKVVEGTFGIVAATTSPIASQAGIEALRQGGTAADAAATTALTQVATSLGSYVSYAGILQLLYYDAKSSRIYSLNAGWNSYLGEADPQSIPRDDLGPLAFGRKATEGSEGRKTLVPGFMAGIQAMHKRFGRLPFRNLFQPAIFYAKNGVTISPLLAGFFRSREKYLARTAEGRAFLNQAGEGLPKIGDRFVQADLTRTLEAVSRTGARYMYSGKWGQQFVRAVQREGGRVTMADMKRYRPIWEKPLSSTFLGHEIFVPGKSSSGGYQILEALNLATELKLDQMGPYQHDPRAFRVLARILRNVEADSFTSPQITEYRRKQGLSTAREDHITKAYAKALAAVMNQDGIRGEQPADSPHHSDAIVVVDRWGNIAALTHSINTLLWGTTGMVVGGIPIPDAAGLQQERLAAINPGDRVPNDMVPVIALKAGQPVLAISGIGSSLMPETVRIIIATFGNHLDLTAIMAAPPLLINAEPWKPGDTLATRAELVPEGAYDPDFLKTLKTAGLNIEERSRQQVYIVKGTAVPVSIDLANGLRRSVETPGIVDFAESY